MEEVKCYENNVIKTFGLSYNQGIQINSKTIVSKTYVNQIDLVQVKPQRAGVILYTVYDDITYFGFGLDAKTHDLTDFGGGVIYKKDMNVIAGALREFEEETLEIFNTLSIDDVLNCPVLYDNSKLIIFIHIKCDPNEVCEIFNEKYKKVSNNTEDGKIFQPEVCAITWLTFEDFQKALNERGILFSRVQRFLLRTNNIWDIL